MINQVDFEGYLTTCAWECREERTMRLEKAPSEKTGSTQMWRGDCFVAKNAPPPRTGDDVAMTHDTVRSDAALEFDSRGVKAGHR